MASSHRHESMMCELQGLHEAGYKIITVGHSLGAGAAAILAMILRSRCGSTNKIFVLRK